jgi:hypothetical protein
MVDRIPQRKSAIAVLQLFNDIVGAGTVTLNVKAVGFI